MSTPWHTLDAAAVAQRLGSDTELGLSAAEAQLRLGRNGRNDIVEAKRRSPLAVLPAQFADFMVLVLLAAAAICALVGDPQDVVVIFAIVVLDATDRNADLQRHARRRALSGRRAAARQRRHRTDRTHRRAAAGARAL